MVLYFTQPFANHGQNITVGVECRTDVDAVVVCIHFRSYIQLGFNHAVLGTHFICICCQGQLVSSLLVVSVMPEDEVVLHLPNYTFKTPSIMDPEPRCEPSTYQPITMDGT